MAVTSLSLPKHSDVNFHRVLASCLHSGFWHFIDKVKAGGMTGAEERRRRMERSHTTYPWSHYGMFM